jgi:hypothetical protein
VESVFTVSVLVPDVVGNQSDFNHAISAAEHAVLHGSGIGTTERNNCFLIAVVDFYERLGGL